MFIFINIKGWKNKLKIHFTFMKVNYLHETKQNIQAEGGAAAPPAKALTQTDEEARPGGWMAAVW